MHKNGPDTISLILIKQRYREISSQPIRLHSDVMMLIHKSKQQGANFTLTSAHPAPVSWRALPMALALSSMSRVELNNMSLTCESIHDHDHIQYLCSREVGTPSALQEHRRRATHGVTLFTNIPPLRRQNLSKGAIHKSLQYTQYI